MKILLLLLAVFLATEPVMSGRHSLLQCMGDRGVCRSSCKKGEQPYFYCRTSQPCCLQSYVRISLTSTEEDTNWSYENQWPKIP
ncbi:beta-defensin 19-like [Nannospalax galili]|uniref:Defensin beta 19 n=1 Tax=Nannospalax galili TaxID=1026970 RepID=A0A8C6QE57_NANGA|nr:beta-defensin 19-like [Nannospalax galili]